jgi:hypothetical protein
MYYTNNPMCTAHISVNKNRVKNYNKGSENSVYLRDGQNFEIELFNPKQNQVLAKVLINGKHVSNSGIILRPGQRIFLERFIDEPRKLKFSTYEVTDNSQVRRAIENNGDVEIQFYDEWIPTTYWYNSNGQPYQGLNFTTTGNVGIGCSSPNSTLTVTGTTSTSTAYYTNTAVAGSFTNSIETGQVEKGSVSSQHFSTAYGNFSYYASQTEKIKIYPASLKPAEMTEVRNYCTNCGTRAKKSAWKFCPNCGQKI